MSTTQQRSNNPQRSQRNRGGRNRGGNRSDRGRRNEGRNEGRSGGGRSRSDTWKNPASGRKKTPKPTLGQKIISILTFGLISPAGKSAGKSKSKPVAPGRSTTARTERQSAPRKTTRESRPQRENGRQREPKPSRTPEIREVTSGRLYVGNLSYDATETDLMDLFKGIGQVQSAEVVSHKRTMRSKGYAFVQMLSTDEAKRAVDVLHDKEFMGRNLVVSGAKAERPKNGDAV